MTRLLRFMSADEAIRLLDGQTIERDTNHRALGNHTTSIGACFAIDNTPNTNPKAMYKTSSRLTGLAMMDVCLIGIIDAGNAPAFRKSTGQYNVGTRENPEIGDWPEMCSTAYRLADFERWWIYTPQLPPYDQMFKLIASHNWQEPVLTRKGQ